MFWGDYFRGTQQFTNATEHGAYLLLIAYCWNYGKIPSDDDARRRIAKCTPRQWALIRDIVSSKFDDEGRNQRCSEELAYAIEKSKTNSTNVSKRYTSSTAPVDTPTPTPTPTKKDKIIAHQDARKTNGHNQFESLWQTYPNKKSKRTAEKAYLKAIKLTSHEKIVEALERAKQKDHRFREVQFTPYLASWLNAGGWEDELELPRGDNEPDHTAITRNMTEEERKQYTQDYMRRLREQLDADEHTKSTH